ncbi:ABC transporter permease [Paraburkholderia susongensis]|uniref:NitT/TauT family transport system permease protein n=1 Tax=Paraburkholderia susongensis TaxID=1515439 RepID=A0A1X7LAB1_9BURK|nr:ABC transporter permease subunit [Paraburkholderia susongensis]SMG50424.1 NitT/TauT family transport system permease protein [Paraburkholderia susongensis]
MSTQTQTLELAGLPANAELATREHGKRLVALLAALGWLGGAAVTQWWPALDDWPYTRELLILKLVLAVLSLAIGVAGWRSGASAQAQTHAGSGRLEVWFKAWLRARLNTWLSAAAWLLALSLGITAWEIATAQLEWLPRPFFAPPQALIAVYADDLPRLAASVAHSFVLLAYGYAAGALTGFVIGVAIGWSKAVGYWLHPVLRLVGPLPATAWLPLAFFFFPSSFSASVFLIALATAFPVAVLTWSGVASVNSAYYDVARTLGAKPSFLILRVAIPAALPSVFVGLFMGLGASFAVLIVAEMMGVKAGLGWYLQWAQGWAAYSNMYAALLVMALMCSGLITLLFRVRDRLLAWQKGMLKW